MSTHTLIRNDNWPMSSKIITTVIVVSVISPFAYFTTADAMSIKQNLQKQNEHIEQLNTESVKLDEQIEKTVEVKEQTAQEVQQIEQETQDAISERQKLEAELGAN